jgi:hypothetical protein
VSTTAAATSNVEQRAIAARRAWTDVLIAAIDALPLPAWLVYILFGIAALGYAEAVAWIAGEWPAGTFMPAGVTRAFYLVYPLALVHYLHLAAARSWLGFRPALNVSDADATELGRELTTTPWRTAVGAAIVGVLIVGGTLLADPLATGVVSPGDRLPALILQDLAIWFTVSIVLVLIFEIYRMLRFVSRALARVMDVNLFQPQPLYALSDLTVRAAVGLIAIPAFQLLTAPPAVNLAAGSLVWLAMIAITGVAAFVLPLRGIHGRIVAEKRQLQSAAGERLATALTLLHDEVDGRDLGRADGLNKMIASLIQERDLLGRLPTWPWQPGTPWALISAIGLPIVVWLATRVLERLI